MITRQGDNHGLKEKAKIKEKMLMNNMENLIIFDLKNLTSVVKDLKCVSNPKPKKINEIIVASLVCHETKQIIK
jgi:hypothetical protein